MADPNKWVDLGIADYFGYKEKAEEHNEPIRAALDEERRQEEEDKENERREKEQKAVDTFNNIIKGAENAIYNNQDVQNDTIEDLSGNDSTVIQQLMKKYKIDVPIKTKGWINNALVKVFYKDGMYTYSYYTSSANSTVFINYLNDMVMKVKEVYDGRLYADVQKW